MYFFIGTDQYVATTTNITCVTYFMGFFSCPTLLVRGRRLFFLSAGCLQSLCRTISNKNPIVYNCLQSILNPLFIIQFIIRNTNSNEAILNFNFLILQINYCLGFSQDNQATHVSRWSTNITDRSSIYQIFFTPLARGFQTIFLFVTVNCINKK